MAVKTTLQQIEEVQAAITAVLAGQEVYFGGKRLRLADFEALSKYEEVLLARYRGEQGGGLTVVTGIIKRD